MSSSERGCVPDNFVPLTLGSHMVLTASSLSIAGSVRGRASHQISAQCYVLGEPRRPAGLSGAKESLGRLTALALAGAVLGRQWSGHLGGRAASSLVE